MSAGPDAGAGGARSRARRAVLPSRGLSRRSARQPPDGHDGAAGTESAVVDCAFYRGGRREGGRLPLEEALERAAATSGGFVWIGLHAPSAAEFDAVSAKLGLPALAVEDAVHAHQRPKLEVYEDVVFVVLKTVRYIDPSEVVDVGELMLFLGKAFVVTVRHGPASPLTDVRQRLEADPELLAAGPSAVLYAVADHVVDEYEIAVAGISDDIDEIELQVFSGGRSAPTERLYKLKREVMEFHRAVRPLVAPMERLVGRDLELVDDRAVENFRDVHDHVLRVAEQVDTFDQLLAGALNANLAQIQTRDNEDMRKITAWVAIVAADTLVAGVYGMNFEHMPELTWRYGYPMALLLMVAVSVLLYRGFRRNNWL
jgi:magnesium transporter